MEINNNNAMIHALNNAAKNSPNLADELRSNKGKHHKEEAVTLIESKKIGMNDIPSSVVDLASVKHRPNVNADLDTSEMRLLRYKNFHETDSELAIRDEKRIATSSKLEAIENKMRPLYDNFKQQVTIAFPDLADKKYGITVDEEGELVIIKGSLNESQQEILNEFINHFSNASEFKNLAREHVDTTVNLVELDRKPDQTSAWIGRFNVSKENYHQVIDLDAMFKNDGTGMDYTTVNSVVDQVFAKAELTGYHHQVDEYVNGNWVNVEV